MKKLASVSLSVLLTLVLLISYNPLTSYAQDATLVISASVSGNTVTGTVSASRSDILVQYTLTYDATVLQPISGTSNILDGNSASFSFNIVGSGTTTISATNIEAYDINRNPINCVPQAAPVTVGSQPVDPNPEPQPPQTTTAPPATQPTTTVAPAQPTDPVIPPEVIASMQQSIAAAESQSIAVAESIAKEKEESLKASLTEAADMSTEDIISSETDGLESTDSVVLSEEDDLSVKVVGRDDPLWVRESLDGIELPDGFSVQAYVYHNQNIEVATNSHGIILFYLTDEDGNGGAFYVYNESTEECIPYVTINSNTASYIILEPDADVTIPSGLEETMLTFDGQSFPAWRIQNSEDESLYIVYAMNENGEKNFYRFDMTERSFLRFVADGTADQALLEGYQYDASVAQAKYNELNTQYSQDMIIRLILIIALLILVLVLIFVIVVLVVKRKYSDEDEDGGESGDDFEEIEDELDYDFDEEIEDDFKLPKEEAPVKDATIDLNFLSETLGNIDEVESTQEDDVVQVPVDDSDDNDFEIVDFDKDK